MDLQRLTNILLHTIGNEENMIKNEELHFVYLKLVLYLCKLEKGILGYCSNKQCCCRTNKIILKMLENDDLVNEIEKIIFITKEDIINAINEFLKEVE